MLNNAGEVGLQRCSLQLSELPFLSQSLYYVHFGSSCEELEVAESAAADDFRSACFGAHTIPPEEQVKYIIQVQKQISQAKEIFVNLRNDTKPAIDAILRLQPKESALGGWLSQLSQLGCRLCLDRQGRQICDDLAEGSWALRLAVRKGAQLKAFGVGAPFLCRLLCYLCPEYSCQICALL